MSRCPICKKPTETSHAPFCSKRCADIDLSRWLGGAYKVETDEAPEILEQMQNVQKDFD